MVSTAREEGVVKLVHPGPHIEILKEPITASEVMTKNPRHCITRPDVFEFPWIVVKPESVLIPGRVYYIVPYRTIDDLIKTSGNCNQPLPLSGQRSRYSRTRHRSSTLPPPSKCANSSPTVSCAGITPKHLSKSRGLISCASVTVSPFEEQRGCIIRRRYKKRISQVESCSDVVKSKCRNSYGDFKGQSLIEIMTGDRTYRANEETSGSMDNYTSTEETGVVVTDGDSSQSLSSAYYEQPTAVLKSCLRKPYSIRKSLSLKVAFGLPNADVRLQRRANKSSTYKY